MSSRLFQLLGSFIGWVWFDLFKIRKEVVLSNISIAFPEKEESEKLVIARGSMASLGRAIVDVFRIPFVNKKWSEQNVVNEGLENIDESLKKGKGAFGLTLHLGSGDLGVASLNYAGLKMNLITKRFKTKWLNDYWFKVREKHGTKLIEDRNSVGGILRALKKNEFVVFVLDQFMGPPLGVETEFFGRKTGTAMGLAMLAGRSGAAVIPCYTYYREDGKLVNVFEPEIPYQDLGSREETIKHMTQIYTEKIEEIVRKYPEQWMWVHRRWKEFKV